MQISHDTHVAVDQQMQQTLDQAYTDVKDMLQRNRPALDALITALMQAPNQQLEGPDVRQIVERDGDPGDLRHRQIKKAVFA